MATSSALITSRSLRCQLPWLHSTILLFLSTFFYTTKVSCSKTHIPYSEHCASIVPQATPTDPESSTIPFPPNQDGYYFGGSGILDHPNSSHYYYSSSNRKNLLFRTHHVYSTNVKDIYKVEATLILQSSQIYYSQEDVGYSYSSGSDPGSFEVEGYWSKSTGKLCMVGSGSTHSSGEGKPHVLDALLKLNDVTSSSNITSLVRGTLESLGSSDDSDHFEPISLLMFPQMNYNYTEVSKDFDHVCTGGIDDTKSMSLRLPLSKSICSVIFSRSFRSFQLKYVSSCNSTKTCNPFGEGVGYLPQVMSMSSLQCSHDQQSLRLLVEFTNGSYGHYYDRPFNPNTTLIAEGRWDGKKNQLCVVACRILNASNSLNSSHVEDCSIRLNLRFPAIWSIRNITGIVGHIWSIKTVKESGYFDKIMFQSRSNIILGIPGLKYEYTMVDKARESCPKEKPSGEKRKLYPDGNPYDMKLDMSIKNSKGRRIGWGYSSPIFVGDQIRPQDIYFGRANSLGEAKDSRSRPLNISYEMSLTLSFNASSREYTEFQLSAEGIYDAETGVLCMVGCKYPNSDYHILTNDSMDCEILVNLQFPPVDSNNYIKGQIKSTRKEDDSQYFETLSFSAVSFSGSRKSIWRMDLEIIMSLVSNTLVCIFVGYQILYAKKHPSVFPFISILMLVVLALGNMIPLVLNFEAFFLQKQTRQTFLESRGGWLEVNEVVVRVVTMVAFLLQCRLLVLVWSARLADEHNKASWVAEKKTLYVCLPLYIVGCLTALLVNTRNDRLGEGMYSTGSQLHSHWVDLRSYAGLVLDCFLFPQILLNIYQISRENALSLFFYMGTTLVRVVPHAYDLYRAHYHVDDFDWSYIYANPTADYYSIAWDIAIPLVGLLFATIIYLQQRFGGRCFLPKRFRELEAYEKVPTDCDA